MTWKIVCIYGRKILPSIMDSSQYDKIYVYPTLTFPLLTDISDYRAASKQDKQDVNENKEENKPLQF